MSRWLVEVENGEVIVLCRRYQPIAEIRPLAKSRASNRPVGLARGQFDVPSTFFDPLPDDVVAEFEQRPAKR